VPIDQFDDDTTPCAGFRAVPFVYTLLRALSMSFANATLKQRTQSQQTKRAGNAGPFDIDRFMEIDR